LKAGVAYDQLKPYHSDESFKNTTDDSVEITMVEASVEPELVVLAKKIDLEIISFLKSHKMYEADRPHVSSKLSPFQLKKENPQIYENIERRLKIKEDELNELNLYLCAKYATYLVGTDQVTGRIQRLEDLTDFLIKKYEDGDVQSNKNSECILQEITMHDVYCRNPINKA